MTDQEPLFLKIKGLTQKNKVEYTFFIIFQDIL